MVAEARVASKGVKAPALSTAPGFAICIAQKLGTCLRLRELPEHCWLCRASRQLVRKLN